jgi:UDP-glucose 4-epimerase
MAFHRFLKAALGNHPIALYGDGQQTRDFTFVDDIVAACRLAAAKAPGGAVYNIGGGSRITINDVLKKMELIINRPIRLERYETQKGDMRHTYADTSRARDELGFEPRVSLDQGLALEAEWIESRMELLV